MSLEEEQHEDTDSLLDELEAAERRNETSLSSDTDDTNDASILAAAMAGWCGCGFENWRPPHAVGLCTPGG